MTGRVLSIHEGGSVEDRLARANRVLSMGAAVYRMMNGIPGAAEPGDIFFPSDGGIPPPAEARRPDSRVPSSLLEPLQRRRAALLWDASYLWGVVAVRGLDRLGFEYDLITGSEVSAGSLDGYSLLVVPGGHAARKSARLSKGGRAAVRRFVRKGGMYLGFCGGAGLALEVPEGLRLLSAGRKPARQRLPNVSGSILVRPGAAGHTLWLGVETPAQMCVWWPSQFQIRNPESVQVVCRYAGPGHDLCVSDLNVREIERSGSPWEPYEKKYGIRLNPKILVGEPAVLEGAYGDGRVVASYPHLETPGNAAGALALFNVWHHPPDAVRGAPSRPANRFPVGRGVPASERARVRSIVTGLSRQCGALLRRGTALGLWAPRNDWLLTWRRGVKGFVFNSVAVLVGELERLCVGTEAKGARVAADGFVETIEAIERHWSRFFLEASSALDAWASGSEVRAGGVVRAGPVSEWSEDREPCRSLLMSLEDALLGLLRGRPQETRHVS